MKDYSFPKNFLEMTYLFMWVRLYLKRGLLTTLYPLCLPPVFVLKNGVQKYQRLGFEGNSWKNYDGRRDDSVSPNLWVKSIQIDTVFLHDEMGSIEAPWQLSLKELGPFVVDIDTKGGRLFDKIDESVKERLGEAYKSLDIPTDFRYTKLY